MGLSFFKFAQWAPEDASFPQQSVYWPFIVVQGQYDFGTNRKRVYMIRIEIYNGIDRSVLPTIARLS